MKTIIKTIIILSFFTSFSFLVMAQTSYVSSLSFDVFPKNPTPNSKVILNVHSLDYNLNQKDIGWYLNDNLIESGIGQTKFSFKTSNTGITSSITVVVKIGERTLSKSIKIEPTEVILLWEAVDSYTPPFYKGKALPIANSNLKIIAIPNIIKESGAKIGAKNLIYKWQKNYSYQDFNTQSGYGKDFVTIKTEFINKTQNIGVNITVPEENLKASNLVSISSTKPKLLFYEKHPLEGILYEKHLGNTFILENEEVIIVAEPFFITPRNRKSSSLKYEWKINGKKIEESNIEEKGNMTFRSEGGSGKANISLQVRNISTFLQTAYSAFSLNFSGLKKFNF